jgi:hypothetical protein
VSITSALNYGPVNASTGGGFVEYDYGSPTPEPATLSLIGGALLGLGMLGRKRFSRPRQ